MYKFFEGSAKRDNIFQEFDSDQGKGYLLLPLKSQSIMRCHAVGKGKVNIVIVRTNNWMQLSINNCYNN